MSNIPKYIVKVVRKVSGDGKYSYRITIPREVYDQLGKPNTFELELDTKERIIKLRPLT